METPTAIRPEDRRSVLLLFLYGFGNAAAYVLAKTIADSAFLSHIGPDRLPQVLMVAAGVVAMSSFLYGQLVRVIRLRRVVLLTLLALAGSSAVMPEVMRQFSDSLTVFAVVYLLAQVRGSLGTIQYATLINEQFGDGQPERVVGVVGVGATLAGITMGLAIGIVADNVDVESLMYVAAGIDLLTMLPVMALRRTRPRVLVDSGNASPLETIADKNSFSMWDAWRSPYVFSIACVVTVSVFAATLVEYQWKVTAAQSLKRDVEALAGYFGYFYATVYLLTGLMQLFVTGRVLQKRGVLVGLLAFPAALLMATLLACVASAEKLLLWPLTLSKGCDTLKRSMSDPTVQVIYSPLESGLRRQAIAFVAGMAKPFAEALAAVALVGATPWVSTRQISIGVIALIVIWLGLSLRVWRGFRLLRGNSGPDIDPAGTDGG